MTGLGDGNELIDAQDVKCLTSCHPRSQRSPGLARKGVSCQLGITGAPCAAARHQHRAVIVAAAAQYRVPAIYPYYYFMTDGGLVSYGFSSDASSPEKSEFIAAEYVDLILRGANPAELPVRSPRVYELLINLKTAKALGLTVPPALLARADKVFE